MSLIKRIVVFCSLFFSLSAWATYGNTASGGDVGNGGDAVYCRASSDNAFNGYYSLDFLAKYDPENLAIETRSLDESLNRIEKALEEKLPTMAESFKEFRAGLFNETDFTRRHIWEKAAFGLIDLKDEDLVNLFPDNCEQDGKIKVVQAVIRQKPQKAGLPGDKISYKFVPQVVDQLRKQSPTQLSFLLVHEWLWDFSGNVERNRKVNYWLHSAFLEDWNADKWLSNLNGIGFHVPNTSSPVWRSYLCEPDTEHTRQVSAGSNSPILLGQGKVYKRIRTWDKNSGSIQKFYDVSVEFQKKHGTSFVLFLGNDGLTVRSTETRFQIFSCGVTADGRPLACRWIPETTQNWADFVHLFPTIGKDCITFRGRTTLEMGPLSKVEDILFYFPNIRFPN